jgi:NADPH:quinone reductase-like Zn-dependent oxidoreductase
MKQSIVEQRSRRRQNMKRAQTIPETFLGVGYTRDRAGLPLETIRVPVPQPAADQVLIRVAASSLNPLEHKLADLNFMGRTPPVVLGLDLAGVVVAVGHGVSGVAVGDPVVAMADLNGDGGWAAAGASGGEGGYALARQFLTVRKPPSLSFRDAAALPMCFLSAFAGLYRAVQAGDTIYIPGGGGGVGHLAVQMATRALGAGLVISSGSTPQSIALARESGAHHVFNYKRDDIAAEIAKLTSGRGVDLVFDATYSEQGFVETARTVRRGGSWIVLGVGPGKTTRLVETHSPVDAILAERGAKHVNVNLLRYFYEPATLDGDAQAFLERGMALAMEWATPGLVVPHVSQTIDSAVEAINAGLQSLKAGRGMLGKVAVIVDRDLAAGK